ncbi:hypothetical protein Acy02nite_87950 [Actinoplanes cyaneus]|uniref:Uncharacterized protein n=1 Tax=Actinoplanes cyaneus TaxID=52696 RepID=A0A919ISF9_9ACTN|nr:hypothetical protein [Actinoplanes cyaneus]MCW2144144.1 hypothetical protein [Actinoplanes cyaneus]GID70914.1 hypothetical protein Acy02nite_87950 [Actinoplanes cyaneus]
MRRPLIAAGLLTMLYGILGAMLDAEVNLLGVIVFGAALLVLHDGVFLPLVAGAGALMRRLVPPGWHAAVRLAAIVDLAVTVVALPLVLGFGRDAGNPTVLPRPYGKGLLLILIVTTVVVVAGRKGSERFRRRGRR